MLTWRSGIQNLKSKICIRSHPHTYAHLPTDLILESKVQNPVVDPSDKSSNHLLDQVKNLIGNSKSDSQMKIDPEGKQLQIDDLIIIPNNMTTTPPEGGSALQNLAKIASRYQNSSTTNPNAHKDNIKELDMSTGHVSAPKKPRLDPEPPVATPNPPPKPSATPTAATPTANSQSLAALASMNPLAMTPAQQQSLFAMLQPGFFMPKATPPSSPGAPPTAAGMAGPQTPATPSSKQAQAAMSSLFSPFAALGTDPSKLGPEAMKLLQMFDSTLKAAVGAATTSTPTSAPHKPASSASSSSSPKPRNASGTSSATSSPSLQSAKERDRHKITRLPADAKRPPNLQGHSPCAFAQTSNIYRDPYADLTKAKELTTSSNTNPAASGSASDGALDLTSHSVSRPSSRLPPPHLPAPPSLSGGGNSSHAQGINLKRDSALKATPPISNHLPGMMDLSSTRKTEPVKVSPFSTEALLSKSSVLPSPRPPSRQPQNFMLPASKKTEEAARAPTPTAQRGPTPTGRGPTPTPAPKASPAASNNYARQPMFSPQTSTGSGTSDKSRASPWHTPVNSASVKPVNTSATSAASKPAIPVSPVVREDKNKSAADLSFQVWQKNK